MVEALRAQPDVLRIDGGLTANRYLVQRQADVLGVPIQLARTAETTALGAAAMAGVGAGLLRLADIPALTAGGRTVEPRESRDDAGYALWRETAEALAAVPGAGR